MSRRSRIEPVREYLEEEIATSQCILLGAIKDEDFIKAAWVKEFKIKLEKALELCGEEKSKVIQIKVKGALDPFGTNEIIKEMIRTEGK